jgi:hypothetical protein
MSDDNRKGNKRFKLSITVTLALTLSAGIGGYGLHTEGQEQRYLR